MSATQPPTLDYGRSRQPPLFDVKKVAKVIAVVLVIVACYYPFSPGGQQARNMKKAERWIPVVDARLRNDPRFARVRADSFTGRGGSLMIAGAVPSQDDLDALNAIVDTIPFDVTVVRHIRPDTVDAGLAVRAGKN